MSDVMLHGVLNMPLPDDPAECDFMTWMQFKQRARQASAHIHELEDKLSKSEALLAKAVKALDRLARLGNGDTYGNSEGNMIARTTLAELKGQDDE